MARAKAINPDAIKTTLLDKIDVCDGSSEQKAVIYALALKYLYALTYYTAPKYFEKSIGFLGIVMRLAHYATRHNITLDEWKANVHQPFFGDRLFTLPDVFNEVIENVDKR